MDDFKINEYVCRTVDGVDYIGRVRKKEEDDKGMRIWVQFTPPVEGRGVDRGYIEFEPHELERVAISINPPTSGELHGRLKERAGKKPGLHFDDHPLPKTER